ncbi:hypothetical protein BDA99DRAFT_30074 [Phascolomyces articulosus]|uniref:Uncharacterized protein n=1 Tax=Phascolomyces articulosus TaxID=60185 RepID=A0AAD5K2T9_9FUNG|nr:hypothetical protein BDA99DRAFT_30074 [Phascolomyces articulosus]
MAKNNSKGQDSKNSSASPKKTAWRGINLKQKSPSRPASVNSQESRKSTHTITSIEKSTEVSSPLSTEFEVSSPTSTEQQQSSSVEVDAIEKDTNKKATTTTKKTAKSTSIIGDIVSSSPAPAKTATSNTATITTTTTETTSTVAETQKEDAKEEDDGASTPRAGSRRSSFSALDSASEVFEDAFDDHDDYFDDDVPTFDEQSTEKDQIDSALSALSNKNTNDEEHDNVTREEERREKRRATVDEVEGLQISEASSHSPIQAKQEKQLPKDVDNSSENILKKEATSSAIASTFTAAEEAAAAAAAFADGGDNVPTVTTSEESGLEEEPIKMAQPTVLRDNDVTQGNAQLVKETQEHETLLYQEKKEDLAINDITSTVTTDIPLTEPKEPERQSSSNGQQQINGHSNITSVCHEQEEYNHRVVDVLADLENSVSNLQQRYEFPTVNIDTARGGGTSEKSPVEHADSGVFDAKSSEEKSEPTRNTSFSDSVDRKELEMDQHDHLGNLLPAMEDAARETMAAHDRIKVNVDNVNITPEDQSRAARSHEFEHPIEDPIDLDMFRDNVISIPTIDPKSIPINYLSPREQEEADEPVREGMRNLFDNKFMKAKNAFQSKANVEPLYALGLGAMAFIKAMMTYQGTDVDVAMSTLASAYTIAKAQIDNTAFKKPLKEAVSQYFSSMLNRNGSSNLPSNPAPITRTNSDGQPKELPTFLPNSILRAHVIKAECCLLMSILQLSQESVVSYLKCGLNLRRAYNSYSIVWQEYKRMGQNFTKYMDRDTVSAIQFGIGAVHLILSSMPQKILKIFSTLGWQSDKQLGFALLKLCLEGRGIRSPLASLT